MSRRIALFALAASAALIATQAHADRECFENSCRLPQVVEPPPPPPPAPAPVKAEDSRASADRTAHELPSDAAVGPPPKPARHAVQPAAVDKPVARLAPAPAKTAEARPLRETSPVVRAAAQPAASTYVRPAPAPQSAYAMNQGHAGGALILNVPAADSGVDAVTAVRPFAIYTENHAPRLYVLAPNAKIIHIDDGN